MSTFDIAKDIIRIGSTAGLSKDVIDLLEKKVALLTEEIASLRLEVSRLKAENENLHKQHQNSQPVGFVEHDGLLWKRNANGFEPRPYCPECDSHPVMMTFPPGSQEMWVCPRNHTFAYDSSPPVS